MLWGNLQQWDRKTGNNRVYYKVIKGGLCDKGAVEKDLREMKVSQVDFWGEKAARIKTKQTSPETENAWCVSGRSAGLGWVREIKAMRAGSKTHSTAFRAWGAKVFTGFLVLVSYSSCSGGGGLLNESEEKWQDLTCILTESFWLLYWKWFRKSRKRDTQRGQYPGKSW